MMTGERQPYTHADVRAFRSVQQLAYQCCEQVEGLLRVGHTEVDAARMLDAALRDRGVRDYFHVPFAWFGARTAFEGINTPFKFFPSERNKLVEGMPVILDVGPVVDGYAADIGYSFSFGSNPRMERAMAELEVFRALILELVHAESTLQQIYQRVDEVLEEIGYENCHTKYPFHVLGHKIGRLPMRRFPALTTFGFDVRSLLFIFGQLFESKVPGRLKSSPFWNDSRASAVRAEPGMWALEPHIGRDGVGAKWEEILVVTDSDAYWLDDDLPHVRRWGATREQNEAGPRDLT